MRLTTRGRYAVMAMVDLTKNGLSGQPITLADIAVRQEIQISYLEQIFAQLRRHDLVLSTRGPGGGYRLNREPHLISISDIMCAVEEEIAMVRCESKGDGCLQEKAKCLTHDLWEALGNQIYRYLKMVSLEDVCKRRIDPFGSLDSPQTIQGINHDRHVSLVPDFHEEATHG
ncbi:MAG: Rrf2 family transcriptional regulator [Alphaproteobacteria bacterium]|nr:Rrf2 family transcriptional regulator [Alphaproteobacteria bacterium]